MDVWKILISGKVQGVSFRASIVRFLGNNLIVLDGYAKNLSNGDVEVVASGKVESLERLVEYCSHGPRYAVVSNVTVIKGVKLPPSTKGFSIS